jgi:hypothetical protein
MAALPVLYMITPLWAIALLLPTHLQKRWLKTAMLSANSIVHLKVHNLLLHKK